MANEPGSPVAHPQPRRILPKQAKGFLEGGLAAVVAGVSTHPLDLIKVRMQLVGEGSAAASSAPRPQVVTYQLGSTGGTLQFPQRVPFAAAPVVARPSSIEVAGQILKTQGVPGLFNGASASALRQALYSSSRFGVYDILKGQLEQQQRKILEERGEEVKGQVPIPVAKKVGAALISGAVGAAVGNPAELAMVRMQADGRLPVEQRRNYKGVGDALARIVREEGVLSLWRGCGPTIYRAMAVTAGQLAVYDQAKEYILDHKLIPDGIAAHVSAAMTAAVAASLASNPFDVVKTRLMNMKPDPVSGTAPYSSALDCALKTVRSEGPLALYKGLAPTIVRQGPFALIMFVTLEQVKKLFANL